MSKLGKSWKGKKLSEEHKTNISNKIKSMDLPTWKETLKGKVPGFSGKKHTEEHKKALIERLKLQVSVTEWERRLYISKKYDFSIRGSLSKYAKEIGVTHTQARRILTKFSTEEFNSPRTLQSIAR